MNNREVDIETWNKLEKIFLDATKEDYSGNYYERAWELSYNIAQKINLDIIGKEQPILFGVPVYIDCIHEDKVKLWERIA